MLLLNLKRITHSGFISFWRNREVSIASILIMTITLFVVGSLLLLNAILTATLSEIENKVDINVYFVTSASEEEILAIKQSLENLPEVKSVEYVSRDRALANFRERHATDQLMLQALDELADNPFGANLSIKAKEPSQYAGIAKFLDQEQGAVSPNGTSSIDEVNYFQNKVAIDRLGQIITGAERFGLAAMLALGIASILITLTTIRLAIYTAREEIAVMRLVGASDFYIRGPFMFEGVMYGFVSGVVTLFVLYLLALSLGPQTKAFFGSADLFSYYVSNFPFLLLAILGSGMVLGAISSYIAVKRYLNV